MKHTVKILLIIGVVVLLVAVVVLSKNDIKTGTSVPTPTSAPTDTETLENQKGYQWAEDAGIGSAEQCKGQSKAFQQGCINYIQDHVDDALQDQDTLDE